MEKARLDILLAEKNIAGQTLSRSKASSLIIEGKVLVNGKVCVKPGTPTNITSDIKVLEPANPYVSRGGVKLKGALTDFNINVGGYCALDIGASTGGFTDCLLKNGCKLVYCVDVGYGQLDYNLRNNENIINYEKTNIKDVGFDKNKRKSRYLRNRCIFHIIRKSTAAYRKIFKRRRSNFSINKASI